MSAPAFGVLRAPMVLMAALTVQAPFAAPALGEVPAMAFRQALSASVSQDAGLGGFYAATDYNDLWTGEDDSARRQALLAALLSAGAHGLPQSRYDVEGLRAGFASAVTEGDRGRLEAAMSRAYLAFAGDLVAGALVPSEVDSTIKRKPARPDSAWLMAHADDSNFNSFLNDLQPKSPQYARMMKEKITLERQIAAGDFGIAVSASELAPGQTGADVVALRDRLQAMGYFGRSATRVYDKPLTLAVQRFQADNGLPVTGVAAESTLNALNLAPQTRLRSVVVALERLRWMDDSDLGKRHIWVNQPDFTAQVVDDGKVTFQTRVVVGKPDAETRSPEFSDMMEFMVINPSWSVPRSITTKEYLPMLRANPNAVSHLQVVDSRGRVVSRGSVNFGAYTAANFPFALRQAPSDGNALGKVKFMFPNEYNIYLHDTPSKSLFANEIRAYSHGCIRVGAPFDLAYVLLSPQTDDPKALFESHLNTGAESRLTFDTPIPVHLVYFTAWPNVKGVMTFRRDVYGRDGEIFDALVQAGLEEADVQG